MLKSHCGRVRFVGRLEAISFLTLLGIAMPLKYLGDMPQAVQVVGWIHGVLFVGHRRKTQGCRRTAIILRRTRASVCLEDF